MKTITAEVILDPTPEGRNISQEIADRSLIIADLAIDASQQIMNDTMETGKAHELNKMLVAGIAALAVDCRGQRLTPVSCNAIEGGEGE